MAKKRYVYTQGGEPIRDENGNLAPIEVSDDWQNAAPRAQTVTEGLVYGGLQATDGTAINSRKKHREYMKANNLTLADDYKQTWAQAAKEREKHFTGQADKPARREAIERALYQRRKP